MNSEPSRDFLAEKEQFMRVISEQMSKQDFASVEEAMVFLNDLMARPMDELLAEFGQRKETATDSSLAIPDSSDERASELARRQAAKRSLAANPECFGARLELALSYRQSAKAEAVFREGVDLGYKILAEYLPAPGEVGQSWGVMQVRPFLELLVQWAYFLWDREKMREGNEVLLEILRLNRDDNQGIRVSLIVSLFAVGDFEKAEEVLACFDDDALFGSNLARVLFIFSRFVSKWPAKLKFETKFNEMMVEEQMRKLEKRNPITPTVIFNSHAMGLFKEYSHHAIRAGGMAEALEAAAAAMLLIQNKEYLNVVTLWNCFPWDDIPPDLYEDYPEDREMLLKFLRPLITKEKMA